jgi:hypothetical protein
MANQNCVSGTVVDLHSRNFTICCYVDFPMWKEAKGFAAGAPPRHLLHGAFLFLLCVAATD